jgi:hypothetical protein
MIIGLIVLTVSKDVAIFLVDAGLLSEEFFSRVAPRAGSITLHRAAPWLLLLTPLADIQNGFETRH